MIRVMIIDDEKIIRDGLALIIRDKCEGFEVVGEGRDGREALALLDTLRPDICIVDIRMRNMDGIEFIRTARQTRDMEYIVLSGYAQFEYAQELMGLGCRHYLLKPVRHQELVEVLESMKAGLARKRMDDGARLSAGREPDGQKLLKWLADGGDAANVEAFPNKQSLMWALEPVISVSFQLEGPHNPGNWNWEGAAVPVLEAIMQKKVQKPEYAVLEYDEGLIVLVAGNTTWWLTQNALPEQCRKELEAVLNIPVSAGFSDAACAIHDAVKRSRAALQQRFYSVMPSTFTYAAPSLFLYDMYEEHEKKIKHALMVEDAISLEKEVGCFLDHIEESRIKKSACYVLLCRMFMLTLSKLSEKGQPELLTAIPSYREFDETLHRCVSIGAVRDYITYVFDCLRDELLLLAGSGYRKTAHIALSFIEDNYNRDISLVEIAEKVSMNPSYFSVMFKREVGETYMDYLIRLRIEKAQELLATTCEKVYKVGECVGYHNPKYFSRIFRQVTGMTPNEYREGKDLTGENCMRVQP